MVSRRQRVRTRTPSVDVTASLESAALELLEESGPQALTVREVAARAGVAPMGVYSRFGSKDGLLEALFVTGFDMLDAAIDEPTSAGALHRLLHSTRAYRRFALDHPQLYHLMFEQMATLELTEESIDTATRTFGTLVRHVTACMDAGELSPGDAVEVSQQLWSTIHGAVSLEIADVHFARDRGESYATMIDAMLIGLGAPTDRQRRS